MDEHRYRLLVDSVIEYAIVMLDVGGQVAILNAGARRLKGYEEAEVLGRHFSEFYPPEDREAGLPEAALKMAVEDGRFGVEGWTVRKDGSRFRSHIVVDPIWGPAGELLGFANITRDLSERWSARERLRQSEEQFRILVQGVGDYAIYMLDAEGHVSSWNPGAQKIKGYRLEEILGRHFSCFYTDEDRIGGEPRRALEAAAREGRYEREAWRVRKDGSRFMASVVIDRICDEEGNVIGFAKVTRDITERVEAQRALDAAREALFQSQKMDALGQLTGGVAHDFNNLLMAIQGSLELLRKRLPEDPRAASLVENAMEGVRRGATLTQRMLAFARRQELQVGPVDVRALVLGMTALLERSLGSSLFVETRFPLVLRSARADANQLELALLNLVVNARDAMPEGGTIVIDAREQAIAGGGADGLLPGAYICLSVTDSGVGMDEGTLARATEPFFTTKGVGKGTGLGLPMVHGLAAQSGGRLVLRSRKGVGTTAELWLPAVQETHAAPEAPAADPERVVAAARKLSILAVDDDPLVLNNIGAMLEDLGHEVWPAASGGQALDLLHRTPQIELVITDQVMPGMTGLQLAAAIRIARPSLPILLASGYAEATTIPNPAPNTGISKLTKPFTQDDLVRSIAAIIDSGD